MPQQAESHGGLDRFDDDHQPCHVTPDELLQKIRELRGIHFKLANFSIYGRQAEIVSIWESLILIVGADASTCPRLPPGPSFADRYRTPKSKQVENALFDEWQGYHGALTLAEKTIQEWMDATNSEPVEANREIPVNAVPESVYRNWPSQNQAARNLECSVAVIRRWVREGRVRAIECGRERKVDPQAAEKAHGEDFPDR